ncbi:chaperone modulatory protein CbpM [Pseudomonas entomophila]|uniref:chaperone modulator CbpM n=1 Tax=Pseudomonas entomophila TaxID=312306 RepID=UPI0015E37AE7|nr:chaperone modulator CbpM [Pseudomonas entomophila]MBA1190086.1 chaperone modulatory protein CbpM [Pseudomonas entomophila]
MSSTLIVQLDMRTLCQEADLTADCVIEIVEHGIVEPSGRTPDDWRFDDQALHLARRAARLRDELELEWEGVALALELLQEVRTLRSENDRLRQRLGRFTQV